MGIDTIADRGDYEDDGHELQRSYGGARNGAVASDSIWPGRRNVGGKFAEPICLLSVFRSISYFWVVSSGSPDKCRGKDMASATVIGLKDRDEGVLRSYVKNRPLSLMKMPPTRSLPKGFLWGFATGSSPNRLLLKLYR